MPANPINISTSVTVVRGASIFVGLVGTAALMVDSGAGYAQLQEEVAK